MRELSSRLFSFGGHVVKVACLQPPEAQARLTLTWQLPQAPDTNEEQSAPPPDEIGLSIWPAAIALCEYIARNSALVKGTEVVELGAGMGLVGLLAAKLGSTRVLLTDHEPLVLQHAQQNAAANDLPQCACLRLDWTDLNTVQADLQQACKVVLAADVLYASVVAQPLGDTLAALLHHEGIAIIGHQIRRAVVLDRQTRRPRLEDQDEPLEKFKAACQAAGMPIRMLSSKETCSNIDNDPMVLLAVGWEEERVAGLPAGV